MQVFYIDCLLCRIAVERHVHKPVKTCNDMVLYFTDDDFSSILTAKVYRYDKFRLTLSHLQVLFVELQLQEM